MLLLKTLIPSDKISGISWFSSWSLSLILTFHWYIQIPRLMQWAVNRNPQKSGLNFNNSAYSVRNKNIVGILNVYSFKAVPYAFLLWFREVIQQMPSVCIYTRLQKSFHYVVFGPSSPLHCFPLHYSHYSNDKIPLKIHIMHLSLMKSK